jgi:hypothetical protein
MRLAKIAIGVVEANQDKILFNKESGTWGNVTYENAQNPSSFVELRRERTELLGVTRSNSATNSTPPILWPTQPWERRAVETRPDQICFLDRFTHALLTWWPNSADSLHSCWTWQLTMTDPPGSHKYVRPSCKACCLSVTRKLTYSHTTK